MAAFAWRVATILLIIGTASYGLWGWLLETWRDSPLDRFGPFFAGISGFLLFATLYKTAKSKGIPPFSNNLAGLPVLGVAAILNLIARDFDIFIFTSLTLPMVLAGSIWVAFGNSALIRSLHALMILVLSIPGVPFLLVTLSGAHELLVLFGFCIMAIGVFQLIVWRNEATIARWLSALTLYGSTRIGVGTLCVVALAGSWSTPQPGIALLLDTEVPRVGEWRGAPLEVGQVEEELFVGATIKKFVYAHPDGSSLSVLKIVSDDVHEIHPPEYCLTGADWTLLSREITPLETKSGAVATTELELVRGNSRMHSRYWFNNGNASLASVTDLRLQRRFDESAAVSLFLVSSIRAGAGQTERQVVDKFMREVL